MVLESEWFTNLDTVIPFGITVKNRFGTKPHKDIHLKNLKRLLFSNLLANFFISMLDLIIKQVCN